MRVFSRTLSSLLALSTSSSQAIDLRKRDLRTSTSSERDNFALSVFWDADWDEDDPNFFAEADDPNFFAEASASAKKLGSSSAESTRASAFLSLGGGPAGDEEDRGGAAESMGGVTVPVSGGPTIPPVTAVQGGAANTTTEAATNTTSTTTAAWGAAEARAAKAAAVEPDQTWEMMFHIHGTLGAQLV